MSSFVSPLATGRSYRAALLSVGPFGVRVVEHLERQGTGTRLPDHSDPADVFAGAHEAVVLALHRPAPELIEAFDDQAYQSGLPWLPVVLEPDHVRVGPVIFPGAGPCHRCYAVRAAEHDPDPALAAAVATAWDRDPALRSPGHLPHQARTAAGLAAAALRRPTAAAGSVLTVTTHRRAVRRDTVLGVHGCPRCDRAERRSALAEALAPTAGEVPGVG
ncbi:TOMM precursor leader peptide-binding protein [Streptomyces sedi]|uniref:TOMM leader peptide-binding protein n=1 Tax=Streptomyces sedi TaxID=555059 RepID=A0A5C4VA27_9ACTN|nr:TOMM precursor leader peptide-binding protein [Streptomyces sedi]TNM32671.1 TOMM precursor leader peptide-binding protein [Streptomyces sedi]